MSRHLSRLSKHEFFDSHNESEPGQFPEFDNELDMHAWYQPGNLALSLLPAPSSGLTEGKLETGYSCATLTHEKLMARTTLLGSANFAEAAIIFFIKGISDGLIIKISQKSVFIHYLVF